MTDKKGKNDIVEQTEQDVDLAMDRERETQLGMSMLAKVALAVVILVSLIISITCVMRFNRLEEEKESLKAQLQTNKELIAEIQYWKDHPVDDEYIEKFAKEYGLEYADAKILLEIIHGMGTGE